MKGLVGEIHDRLDARDKVTGAARYSGEIRLPRQLHAALVLSNVAAGRVVHIDAAEAEGMHGVAAVLSHQNLPRIPAGPYRTWLQDATVHHAGQPVALVLAESEPCARYAAARISVTCESRASLPRLTSDLAQPYAAHSVQGEPAAALRGDLAAGRAVAHVTIESSYTTPTHCHSPMEPHVVIAQWDGDCVTVHTSTSGIFAARRTIAQAMAVPQRNVRVLMRYQGGGFGSKGSAWWPTLILAADAARMMRRPVRLELSREEMFTVAGRRAPTVQHLALGAGRDGRLSFLQHTAVQETSPLSDYSDPTCFASRSVYSSANVATSHLLVRANVPQPNAMRAPGEGPGSFALESALDELAVALQIDPIELRLRNIAARDEHHSRPWSSNGLARCLRAGARAFGWVSRPSASAPRREGRWSVGRGVASAYYPVLQARAAARVTLDRDAKLALFCGNQDIGNGSLTVMAQAVARELGVSADEVAVEYGDTDLPETPMAAGSMATASVIPAVERAARALRAAIIRSAVGHPRSALHNLPEARIRWISPHEIVVAGTSTATSVGELAAALDVAGWEGYEESAPEQSSAHSASAFGACFAEVKVDPRLGIVRLSRLAGAYAAGRILNPKLARSQLIGGMVFGIGMALHEALHEDPASGLPLNRNLTNYLLPVHADVPAIDVHLLEESDANAASHGIKGIGMIGTVGVAAAIANAVFDATGLRIRDLPIVPRRLLKASAHASRGL